MAQDKRRTPSAGTRARLLDEHEYRCAYCQLPFGTLVLRGRREILTTLNWDHFLPYALAGRNPEDNWLPACDVCNGVKSDHVYADLDEAQDSILARRDQLKFVTAWVPETSSEDDLDKWTAEYEAREVRITVTTQRRSGRRRQAYGSSAKGRKTVLTCPTCGAQFERRWGTHQYCCFEHRPSHPRYGQGLAGGNFLTSALPI